MERDRSCTPEDRPALLARAHASRAAAEERMAAAAAMQARSLRTQASREQLAQYEEALAALQNEVHAYVRLLRALGTSPEETVVQVKAAVSDAVGRHGPSEEALMARVVTWAVDAYYTG